MLEKKELFNVKNEIDEIRRINSEIKYILNKAKNIQFLRITKGIPRFVRDMSKKLNKSIRLKIEGEEVLLDRTAEKYLNEIIKHIVRNSIVHGIEEESERKSIGKGEIGKIKISAKNIKDNIIISIQDDGKGISFDGNDENILSEIIKPGFTTKKESDLYSGRGVGLDIVNKLVTKSISGKLEVKTKKNIGTKFIITIKNNLKELSVLIFKYNDKMIAIPEYVIKDKIVLSKKYLEEDKEGFVKYRERYLIYSIDGKFEYKNIEKLAKYGMIIKYSGKENILMADDLLFELKIDEENIKFKKEIKKCLFEISLNGEEMEYMYLFPSIII